MNYSLIICNDLGRKFERWKEQNIIRKWQEVRKPYNKSKEEVTDFNHHQFFGSSSLNQVSEVKMEGGSYPNLELFISNHYHCILWVFIKIKETLHETEGHWFSFRKALPGEPSTSLIPFKGGHHELSIFTSSKINDIGPFLLTQI